MTLLYTIGVFGALLFLAVLTEVLLRMAGCWPEDLKTGFGRMYFAGSVIVIVAAATHVILKLRDVIFTRHFFMFSIWGAILAVAVYALTRPVKQRM
ncbi:MAG: hypothetical protein NTW29_12320 [Bacteroidetes bacterium]|nr:hypothetical protein [Bacteroidota bacterium]